MDESIEGALLVIDVLDKLHIPYYVGGSLASSTYGEHRSTAAADLIADIRPEHIDRLVGELSAEFYTDAEMMRDAIRRQRSFNLLGHRIFAKIDVFIPRKRAYDREPFERRALRQIDADSPREVYIASPEDTVLAKLEWYRMGHEVSDRQWSDIVGVLAVQAARLDLAYLRRWAADLDVVDLLERALGEADSYGR